jgi:hypothetical protein
LRVALDEDRPALAEPRERVQEKPTQFDRAVAQREPGRGFGERRRNVPVVGEEQRRCERRRKRFSRAERDSLRFRRKRRCVG